MILFDRRDTSRCGRVVVIAMIYGEWQLRRRGCLRKSEHYSVRQRQCLRNSSSTFEAISFLIVPAKSTFVIPARGRISKPLRNRRGCLQFTLFRRRRSSKYKSYFVCYPVS